MTAQRKHPKKLPIKSVPRKRKGSKVPDIIRLATKTNSTNAQIAQALDISQSNVIHTLQRYGIELKPLETFKRYRPDILTGIQRKLLKYINDDMLKKASINNIAYAYQQFNQCERLERGQLTALSGLVHGDIMEIEEHLARAKSVDNPVDKNKDKDNQ